MPAPTATRAGAALAATGIIATGAALLLAFPPGTAGDIYPACPFKALTGLDCPFCGGLRATHALLTGDIGAAADHNVLVVIGAALGVAGLLWWGLRRFASPVAPAASSQPDSGRRGVLVPALVTVLAVFWVVRNLPFVPYLGSGPG